MPDEGDIAQEHYERFLEARLKEHKYSNAPRPPLNLRGGGKKKCIDCGDVIPEKRRKAASGCMRCIECQKAFEEGR